MFSYATANPPTLFMPSCFPITDDADQMLQSLDAVDADVPYSGRPMGSPTRSEEDVLDLDVSLDVENARLLIGRFERVRRELDLDADD